ncbi:MAG: AmmeMemoRadiSam system radical SAM enzyme [Halieaceae bacterium]|jgi:pyruvate formate lyase activating enzyme|nr:AmmeMemoRadiSam system radical SAM enzyme [Halieaceae bacterium]
MTDSTTVSTRFWHEIADGRVQCDLCPRFCKLREGQRGLCFVRARQGDEVVLTSYGRTSGIGVDPIEKKPLNHFLPGSQVLSFGTAGCNLACKFCQNWDMSKSREMHTLAHTASPEYLARSARELGCSSIAFTYNDPVIFHEYAIDVAAAARRLELCTVAVTAGYISPQPRREFFAAMDAANIDLKCFSEDFYYRLCGAHLHDVLDTLVYVKHQTRVWLEISTLLIPGHNDSTDEIKSMCEWILSNLGPDVPHHFSAFHPDWKMRDTPRTPISTLSRARQIALDCGLHHVYTGNIHDPVGSSTYCSNCGKQLIERNRYEVGEWLLDAGGRCLFCRSPLAGVLSQV